jgi:hypothetical protein
MSSFLCPCGKSIADDGAINPNLGKILRDQSDEQYHQRATQEVTGFIKAIQSGKRKEWMEEFYGKQGFDLDDPNVVFDIWTRNDPATMLDIHQCDACGRIFIERAPHTFTYRVFKPEHDDWRGALTVELSEHVPAVRAATQKWWRFW